MAAPEVIAIGASTGGVDALLTVLSAFPADCPPTLIVQHMKPEFLGQFGERLDRHCRARVRLARDNDRLKPGRILLAPGEPAHLCLSRHTPGRCQLHRAAKVAGHRPSVDMLFASLSALGPRGCGVLLTGMGRDGAEGLLQMRIAGALTICQDEASSVVYGMPRAAVEIGACARQLPLDRIGPALFPAGRPVLEGSKSA